jgi:polar amino acid transport system permease protein
MSASILVNEELQSTPPPSPPRPVIGLAVLGAVLAVAGTLLALDAAKALRDFNHGGVVSTIVGAVLVLASLYSWWPALQSFRAARERSTLLRNDELVAARRVAARGREEALISMGYAAAVVIVSGLLLFILGNDGSVATTFFAQAPIRTAFHDILKGFWINVWAACVAQVLVLILGLVVAVIRMLPGRAGAPLRMIAIIYCDVFRAIPAIVLLLLIGFGIPIAGIPWLSNLTPVQLGIMSLTLTYTSYVSEVYRAGLSSIHPSQSAAARSLGLSYSMTLRTVLVPQAVRRVIPPLLNDFISLQKDTALLSTLAVLESLQTAKLYEANLFNLSPIVLVAGFFIIITIPQARFVDFLIDRDAARRAGK